MNDSLLKLKREIEIRNFSKQTVKGYLYSVEKFLKYAENKNLSEDIVKNYIQSELKMKSPSSVRKDLFAIKFFFENVLNRKLTVPYPKKNITLPEILTVKEISEMIKNTLNILHIKYTDHWYKNNKI